VQGWVSRLGAFGDIASIQMSVGKGWAVSYTEKTRERKSDERPNGSLNLTAVVKYKDSLSRPLYTFVDALSLHSWKDYLSIALFLHSSHPRTNNNAFLPL